jgi:hypothetical protein
VPISALDFSHELSAGFGFGGDRERSVATLRRLAEQIERRDVLLQSARVTGLVSESDFTLTGLRLVLAERITVHSPRASQDGQQSPLDDAAPEVITP